jgi:hypothetical protein
LFLDALGLGRSIDFLLRLHSTYLLLSFFPFSSNLHFLLVGTRSHPVDVQLCERAISQIRSDRGMYVR